MDDHGTTFDEIARRAVDYYAIGKSHLTFLRHSDNVTYKVKDSSGNTYLLRVHSPITEAMGAHGDDEEAVNSELLWLEALSRDIDLILQKPIRNRHGDLVSKIVDEVTGNAYNCTLLQWVDGEHYHRDLETEDTAYQLGGILAKLHNHAQQWQIPANFKRPRRDIAYFENVLKGLHPAVEDGRIVSSDYHEFERSITILSYIMNSMQTTRQDIGIIHGDPHKGNMLFHEGCIRLIDFSFCAFGPYMFDLAICFSDMKETLHHSCLKGYQAIRVLPDDYQRLIEGFFIGCIIGTFSFWVPMAQSQDILVRKVPEIAQNFSRKFNQGDHFWFV